MKDYHWSESYLKKLKKHWENTPFIDDYPCENLFISKEELAAVFFGNPKVNPNSYRLWIAKHQNACQISDYIIDGNAPRQTENGNLIKHFGPKQDDNFELVFKRFSGRGFGLNLNDIQQYSNIVSNRFEQITSDLPKPVTKRVDSFFGTYASTPFGIHQDTASIFVTCLEGERTYHTWPDDYFEERGEHLAITAKNLADSEKFKLVPGKIFYWPSNRWHVVTSNGEPSITAQITLHVK